jgi:hypothetical protein
MKKTIIKLFKELTNDRPLFVLIIFLLILSVVAAMVIGFSVQPSELQLVSHYSAFGITHLYRDQWFYLLVFSAFEVVAGVIHSLVSVKLLISKDRPLAFMFAWLGVVVVILGWITASALLNVWTPL